MRNMAKYCAIFWTSLYSLLFFPLLIWVLCISLITSEDFPYWAAASLIAMFIALLLSLPLSIYLMWRNYLRGRYKRVHLFSIVPFALAGVEYALEWLLRAIFS